MNTPEDDKSKSLAPFPTDFHRIPPHTRMPSAKKTNAKPLPVCPSHFSLEPGLESAFRICKTLESRGRRWIRLGPGVEQPGSELCFQQLIPEMAGRVLGYGLLYPPSDAGRDALATDILGCGDNHAKLAALAHLYVYALIRVFFNPKGGVARVSIDQSPELSKEPTGPEHLLNKPSLSAADLETLVTIREKGHCPITGRMLDESVVEGDDATKIDLLVLSHIVSQSVPQGIEGESEKAQEKFNWARTAAAVIEHFGGFSTHNILGPENLQSPRNAMLLAPVAHGNFDRLDLWLTPFEVHGNVVPNTYKTNTPAGKNSGVYFPTATFNTYYCSNGMEIKPPSPELLALHAACAQVAHMSGAAEHLEETFRDTEPIPVMTAAAHSANELSRALWKVKLGNLTRVLYV